jgi:hypothetical protein
LPVDRLTDAIGSRPASSPRPVNCTSAVGAPARFRTRSTASP